MRYDNKITLSENKKIILEQGNPPIPMPSTQLPSDYTGSGGGFERTQTPTISQERIKSEKLKQQDLNRPYPSNKEEGDRFRAWFNQVFPFKAKNPCGDGQKLDLTGTFNNKFVKCAADFDKYGKRAFKMFLEQKGGVLKVYKSVVDREKQTGVPIGYTNEGWKEYQVKKQEREKECQPKKIELLRKIDDWKKKNPNSMYIPDEYSGEEKKLNEYCSTEIDNLKLQYYNPNFPFGLSEIDSYLYYLKTSTLRDKYPFAGKTESCRNEKYWRLSGFLSMEQCIAESESQSQKLKEEQIKINSEYGYIPKKKSENENLFDKYRLLWEFVGIGVISIVSGILSGYSGGLLLPVAAMNVKRLELIYELVLSAGFFGSLAKYDYEKGKTSHAALDIIFIFLPLIHTSPALKSFFSKFSSKEIIDSSKIIADRLANQTINSPKDILNFLNTLDPVTKEIFIKGLKINPMILDESITKLGQNAIDKLGTENAGKLVTDIAKSSGVKTSLRTGGKFLTNSKFVNGLNKFSATLMVDLSIINLFGEQIYKLLDGEKNDLSVQLKNLENYYKKVYGTQEKIEQAIINDTKKLNEGDIKKQKEIKQAAKSGFTEALTNPKTNYLDDLYNTEEKIKIEN